MIAITDLSCPSQAQRQKERSQEPFTLQRQNSHEVSDTRELDLFSENLLSQISLHERKVPDLEQRQRPSVQREETLPSVSQVQVQVQETLPSVSQVQVQVSPLVGQELQEQHVQGGGEETEAGRQG